MSKELVDAYKGTLYALDDLIRLFEEDLKKFKKIKKNLEQFIPIIENY